MREKNQNSKIIGPIIAKKRKSKGMNQDDLAEASCISKNTLADIEQGYANPELDTLGKIKEALGVDFVNIFSDAPIMPAKQSAEYYKLVYKLANQSDDIINAVDAHLTALLSFQKK